MTDKHLNATALKEILCAAELCINTLKIKETWGHEGRLGFPAALLLLVFIDSAGYLVFIKNTGDDKGESTTFGLAFEKFVESCFSNLSKSRQKNIKEVLCNKYRSYLAHQAGLFDNSSLAIDNSKDVLTKQYNSYTLHLSPLLKHCLDFYNANAALIEKRSSTGYIGKI